MNIPEGFIEKAKEYAVCPKDKHDTDENAVYIGNTLMMDFTVRQQMTMDNIILTMGNADRCIIIVDYSREQVLEMKKRAQKQIQELKDKGLLPVNLLF